MNLALVQAVERLRKLPVTELQKQYRQLLDQESKSTHKEYLYRRIAWQLQAQAEGGLSERALQRISDIADVSILSAGRKDTPQTNRPHKLSPATTTRDARLPSAGALLRRRYQGREVIVQVLDDGFQYQSRHYRSLSAIAREVTGTRWNGLVFFGLTERRHA